MSMTTKTSTEPVWMQAREAVVITVGARAPVYEKAIVRHNKTGQLHEVELNPERPPLDPGDEGRWYVFKKGERVMSDHEAVIAAPGAFVPFVPAPME
jgi:hypothetical protein